MHRNTAPLLGSLLYLNVIYMILDYVSAVVFFFNFPLRLTTNIKHMRASLVAQMVKNSPVMQEMWV